MSHPASTWQAGREGSKTQTTASSVSFIWLEISGMCNLRCTHCYAGSSPQGTHGAMTKNDWFRVIDDAAALDVKMVQFIGGEPTLHPALPDLIDRALRHDIEVEVFTNLTYVTPELWATLSRPAVSLATSYYSDDPAQHDNITGGRSSHRRTKANIAEAIRRGIPIRAGIIDTADGQRVAEASQQLVDLGVPSIGFDRVRQVGRGSRDQMPNVTQLCGHCTSGVLAVSSDGTVWPCVFSRWLPVGNVREKSLANIITSDRFHAVHDELTAHFRTRVPSDCRPDCQPQQLCEPKCEPYTAGCHPECNPSCSPRCNPVSCRPSCLPPKR